MQGPLMASPYDRCLGEADFLITPGKGAGADAAWGGWAGRDSCLGEVHCAKRPLRLRIKDAVNLFEAKRRFLVGWPTTVCTRCAHLDWGYRKANLFEAGSSSPSP